MVTDEERSKHGVKDVVKMVAFCVFENTRPQPQEVLVQYSANPTMG